MGHDPEVVCPQKKMQIWWTLCPSKSKITPILLFTHSTSTFARICRAIFSYTLSTSTLPGRGHRSKEHLLSTHSNMACPSNSDISRKSRKYPTMGIVVHNVCDMPWSCLVERRLDVHACYVHCWVDHTALLRHWIVFFGTCCMHARAHPPTIPCSHSLLGEEGRGEKCGLSHRRRQSYENFRVAR